MEHGIPDRDYEDEMDGKTGENGVGEGKSGRKLSLAARVGILMVLPGVVGIAMGLVLAVVGEFFPEGNMDAAEHVAVSLIFLFLGNLVLILFYIVGKNLLPFLWHLPVPKKEDEAERQSAVAEEDTDQLPPEYADYAWEEDRKTDWSDVGADDRALADGPVERALTDGSAERALTDGSLTAVDGLRRQDDWGGNGS